MSVLWYTSINLREVKKMSSIIYRKKAGVTYAYRTEARYDAEKGYSVPKQTYLGRVDEKTGEIIPSSNQRGRRKAVLTDDAPVRTVDIATADMIETMKNEITRLRQQVMSLSEQNERYKTALTRIQGQLNTALQEPQAQN